MNRTILDKTRTIMNQAGLKESFWAEAKRHAADLHNRTDRLEFKLRTPMEALLGIVPNNASLRIFGCQSYTLIHMAKPCR